MRLSEWCLLLASGVGLAFAPRKALSARAQRHIRCALVVLLTASFVVHVLLEGWRPQMVPIYVVAIAILIRLVASVIRPIATRSDPVPTRRRLDSRLATSAQLLALVAGTIVAAWLMPVPRLPLPTGKYAVGTIDRELVDSARHRRLIVTIWYPSDGPAAVASHTSLFAYPDVFSRGLSAVTGVPALAYQHLRYITLSATSAAPLLQAAGPMPVLVVSHAMMGVREQLATLAQDLASWGYVVIALDHSDAAAVTVFADGSARPHDLRRLGAPDATVVDRAAMVAHVLPAWVADQRAVYDDIERLNLSDPVFRGALDTNRIASIGHSFGGATALEVCLVDARCRAAVDLDGGLYGQAEAMPATRPVLLLTSASSSRLPPAMSRWSAMVQRSPSAQWLELPNSNHLSFGIVPFMSPLLSPIGYTTIRGERAVDVCVRSFLDSNLRMSRGDVPGNDQCRAATVQRTPLHTAH